MLIFGILLYALPVFGQAIDSVAVKREVDSLIQISNTLIGQQKFDEALRVIEGAEAKALAAFGGKSANYAEALSGHGKVLFQKGKYREVEYYFKNAVTIQEMVTGKENADYARYLNNLGIINAVLGQLDTAEVIFLEAKVQPH